MNRYNIFYQVHKGLRTMLYETAVMLQQTDFTNAEESEQAIDQLKNVINLFEKHAHTEDTLVFDAIALAEPSLVHAFEQEHVQDHELGCRLNGIILSYAYAASSQDRFDIGQAMIDAFISFLVFNLHHMAKEEDLINKALWKHYTDAELHGITNKILASIEPQHMIVFSKWMMRGLNNTEIVGWLKEVRSNAPEAAFQGMLMMAQQELSESRWQSIRESLTEGAMLA